MSRGKVILHVKNCVVLLKPCGFGWLRVGTELGCMIGCSAALHEQPLLPMFILALGTSFQPPFLECH